MEPNIHAVVAAARKYRGYQVRWLTMFNEHRSTRHLTFVEAIRLETKLRKSGLTAAKSRMFYFD